MVEMGVPLLLIAGAVGFAVGGCVVAQVMVSVYRRQDSLRARERRVLNAIWRLLRDEFGIDKAPWMADVLDRKGRK